MDSLEDALAQGMNATGASVTPSRTAVGSWVAGASDGTTSGESNYSTYGTMDRTATGNSDFQAYVAGSTGTLTLGKIGSAMTQAMSKGGRPRVGVCGPTVYDKIRGLVEGYSDATVANEVLDFSGAFVRYAGINFGLEYYAPAATLGLLDPNTWLFKRLDIPLTENGIQQDPSRMATYVLHIGGWYSLICVGANRNAKLTGISG